MRHQAATRPLFRVLSGACLAVVALTGDASAQAPLRVYLDCTRYCDDEFIRTELAWLAWMRDRADADVHILITETDTGGGGELHELRFIGLGRFAQQNDTLSYFADNTATDDAVRRGLVRQIRLGLVQYLLDTPIAEHISIEIDAPSDAVETPREHDPWNAWVFSVFAEVEAEGEQSFFSGEIQGGVSAQRITDGWKVRLALDNSYDEQRFEVDSVTEVTRIRREWGATTLVVRSLGSHLAAGLLGSVRSNTFQNLELSLGAAPAIEYNLYPYGDYTSRYLTVLYTLGVNAVEYDEVTIYDKLKETLVRQTLTASLGFTQPWGEVRLSAEGLQYLHDLSRRRLVISGGTEVNLFRGLSLDVGGDFSWIADQLSLRQRDLSEEEILLQGGQLATDFNYELRVGLSYSFGSRDNRTVNARFDRRPGQGGYVF